MMYPVLLAAIVIVGAFGFVRRIPSKIAIWTVVVLTILGIFESPDVMTRLTFVGCAIIGPLLPYLFRVVFGLTVGPLIHYSRFASDAHRAMFNVLPGDPDDIAAGRQQDSHAASLVATGFVRRGRVGFRVGANTVVNELLDRGDGREWAIITATLPAGSQPVILHCSCEFADGETLAVNNYPWVDPNPPSPGNETIRLPSVTDANDLVRACLTIAGRSSRGPIVRTPLTTDLAGRVMERTKRRYEAERRAGWVRYDSAQDAYRLTLYNAYRMFWRSLPPLNWIVDRAERAREQALLAEMKLKPTTRTETIPGATSAPHPTTRQYVTNLAMAAGLTAFIVLMPDLPGLLMGRSTVRAMPAVTVTSDFTVPNTFELAVRAFERLAGQPSHQLIGNRDDEPTPTPGVAISMRGDSADAYVAAAQKAFLASGFFLFRTGEREQNGLEKDALALYPARDPYVIMRAMETNGSNHGLSTDDVIAWFRREEARYPVRFGAIAYDYVGGYLEGDMPDETEFGRRFIRFCPDVQAEGIVTARSVGRDFKRTREIYCWWD